MSNKGIVVSAVVAPIIVGLMLLQIEYSFFSISGGANRELRKEAEKVLSSIATKESLKPESYIEEDIENLEILYQIASKIYGADERNAEYIKIIDVGLSEDKPGFSFVVAKEIYGVDDRNKKYSEIIDASIKLEKFALALAVSEEIYGVDLRNKKYKEIIAAGIEERKARTVNVKPGETVEESTSSL